MREIAPVDGKIPKLAIFADPRFNYKEITLFPYGQVEQTK
jgi:hypothetical protein